MAFSPSKQQVADVLPHLRYEIEQTFIVPAHDTEDWHVRESVFLAILVHARLLLDFFEHGIREHDDVMCADFGFTASPVPLCRDDRSRLNKDIAHLTYSRLRHTPSTKPWPVGEILSPLKDRTVAFIAHILERPPECSSIEEIENWRILHDAFTKQLTKRSTQQPPAPLFAVGHGGSNVALSVTTINQGGCG